jgi:protein SCO1/2
MRSPLSTVSQFIVAGAIGAAALVGCAPIQAPPVAASAPTRAAADAGPSSRVSLFAHPWVWTDERGERVEFSRWRGKPLVVTAIYATCKSTCPRTIGKLQKLEDTFRREGRSAQFLLVTLDPITDTTENLRSYKAAAGFPEAWHLLAGDVPETRELTDLLDIHVIDDGPHLMHDAKIVVFDERGLPTRSFGGWALDDESRPH